MSSPINVTTPRNGVLTMLTSHQWTSKCLGHWCSAKKPGLAHQLLHPAVGGLGGQQCASSWSHSPWFGGSATPWSCVMLPGNPGCIVANTQRSCHTINQLKMELQWRENTQIHNNRNIYSQVFIITIRHTVWVLMWKISSNKLLIVVRS